MRDWPTWTKWVLSKSSKKVLLGLNHDPLKTCNLTVLILYSVTQTDWRFGIADLLSAPLHSFTLFTEWCVVQPSIHQFLDLGTLFWLLRFTQILIQLTLQDTIQMQRHALFLLRSCLNDKSGNSLELCEVIQEVSTQYWNGRASTKPWNWQATHRWVLFAPKWCSWAHGSHTVGLGEIDVSTKETYKMFMARSAFHRFISKEQSE